MERLTERWGDGDVWVKQHDYVSAAHRLADYEDTGMTPEEVNLLAKADKEGRVVVMPCKVGDTVYWVHNRTITKCRMYRIQKNHKGIYICLRGNKKSYGAFRADFTIGKTIFLTREEAQKSLERTKV